MSSIASRRPGNSILSCQVYNVKEEGDDWKPSTFHLNDWITMFPSCKGAHKVKKIKRDAVENHWKGRIIEFKISKKGWLVKVQHVYLAKDMTLHQSQFSRYPSYYVFPSTVFEWQPIQSLSGTFNAIHKGIADAMFPNEPPTFFKQRNMFVFFAKYKVPTSSTLYGSLEELPVPELQDYEWNIPDRDTISIFQEKLTEDILKAMTPGRISRRIRLQWFLPIHVFVALFKKIDLQRTKTMWLKRRLAGTELTTVLGQQWSTKETSHIGDIIKCSVSLNSLSMSYRLCRQSLVLGFDFRRWKKKLGSWVPLDSDDNCREFEVEVLVGAEHQSTKLIVTKNWTFQNIRECLEFLDDTTLEFRFIINNTSLSARLEKSTACHTCLPPNVLIFKPLEPRDMFAR